MFKYFLITISLSYASTCLAVDGPGTTLQFPETYSACHVQGAVYSKCHVVLAGSSICDEREYRGSFEKTIVSKFSEGMDADIAAVVNSAIKEQKGNSAEYKSFCNKLYPVDALSHY